MGDTYLIEIADKSAIIEGKLEGRIMGVEPLHLEMVMPKETIVASRFNHNVVVGKPGIILSICPEAAKQKHRE